MSNGKSFDEQWAFPSDVKAALGAASYDVQRVLGTFRSGRQRWQAVFRDVHGNVLSRRTAMELTSKRTGAAYHVCERNEPTPLPPLPLRREKTRDYLDEIYG